jgi:hypothetical protein
MMQNVRQSFDEVHEVVVASIFQRLAKEVVVEVAEVFRELPLKTKDKIENHIEKFLSLLLVVVCQEVVVVVESKISKREI